MPAKRILKKASGLPKESTQKVSVKILTLGPTQKIPNRIIEVSATWGAGDISKQIQLQYGKQFNGDFHNWEYKG